MARLSNFHLLCPLIDQSSFLGVVSDSVSDCVVVTLGRNIVIRYKISDRKQVGSWSTRDKLSSPVIYDPVGCQYVAVFNRNQIRTWKQDDEDLDSIKKHKFPEEIQCLLVCPGTEAEPVVLFRSGRICKLSSFLNHKDKIQKIWKQQERRGLNMVLRSDEILEDSHMIKRRTEMYVLVSARTSNKAKQLNFYLMKLLNEDDKEYFLLRRFSLHLHEAWIVGHTVIQQKDSCSLLTLWSNGKIYSLTLNMDNVAVSDGLIENMSEHCKEVELSTPGSIIDSVKELLDVENDVALVALGPDHLALYGADLGQKGAVVYIVDIHSSVTGDLPWEALKESAAKQCLKHFNSKEMLPRIWNAAGHLFIPSSDGRLVLASYELGPHPPLADLLGCLGKRKININNNGLVHHNQLQHVSWLSNRGPIDCTQTNVTEKANDKVRKYPMEVEMPEKVYTRLKALIEEGLPESRICSIIFPALMEDGDVESISWCLSHFRDIPEANLVDLLCFFLNQRVATSPCKKEDLIQNEKTLTDHGKRDAKISSSEEPLKHAAIGSTDKPLMNGDIHESVDSNSHDSLLEDSEMKDVFEVGHTFVKGRRKSLRIMNVSSPQHKPSMLKVNSTVKKIGRGGKNDSQEILKMEVDTPSSDSYCSENSSGKRNSSFVLNGLEVVEEGNESAQCKQSELEGAMEECVKESVSLSQDDKCIANKLKGRTSIETLEKPIERPSILVEGDRKTEMMALPQGQHKSMEKLLSVPVSSVILLPSLRSNLPFHLALKLLRHLLWLLSSPKAPESTSLSDIQLVEWICYLLDAFYQRYTLSQDNDVLETLSAVKEVLDMQLRVIDALKEMEPILFQLKSGKSVKGNVCDKWYSIENIRLY